MARIPRQTIDHILSMADIVDVISPYVELKQRGRNFFGLCPFHPEKTPSFSASQDKQIYYCFGCGNGGNVISFLMEFEKIEFVEAVRKLGDQYNIQVNFDQKDDDKEFFTGLYEIHTLALELYRKNLKSAKGEKVVKYLHDRDLADETLTAFFVGYAGSDWDHLYNSFPPKKFNNEVIEKCGLFSKTEKGNYVDRFRDRIIFPIRNIAGKVIAFGGRDFTGESDAKYLNSPETPIYNKRRILYGLHESLTEIRKKKSIILVEGYTDLLQLWQNGINNIAATSGTAFTKDHVNIVAKYTDTVQIAFDGDTAGKNASVRAGYLLLQGGITPEIVPMLKDSDPDSWVQDEGPEPFEKAVKNPVNLIPFHMNNCDHDLKKPTGRSALAKDMAEAISQISDGVIQRFTLKEAAEALDVEEEVFMKIMEKGRRPFRGASKSPEKEKSTAPSSSSEKAQMEIVKLFASGDPETMGFLKMNINPTGFTHPILKKLAEHCLNNIDKNDTLDISKVVELFEEETERKFAAKLLFEAAPHQNYQQIAIDCIITMERSPLKEQISEKRLELKELEKKGKDTSSALMEVVKLQQELESLKSKKLALLDS